MKKYIANTNIALIKYWGKKNTDYNLPTADSISLTLKETSTITSVKINKNKKDLIILNNEQVESQKITNFLNLIRKISKKDFYFDIFTKNNFPTSAGFASSASGFAALTAAVVSEIGLSLDKKELSIISRYGSGSASRSIFGGFVQWNKGDGEDPLSSYSKPILEIVDFDILVGDIFISKDKKTISSTEGMKRAITSPLYNSWLESTKEDIINIKKAIENKNIESIGKISEKNSNRMHELNHTSKESFTYYNKDTLKIINVVKKLRKKGVLIYYTIDAGPNVKIITNSVYKEAIKKELSDYEIIFSKPGSGVQEYKNVYTR